MKASDIQRLHVLWTEVYPFLAGQVASILPRGVQTLLELGPFSGGISFELAKGGTGSSIVLVDRREEILGYLSAEATRLGLLSRLRFTRSDLGTLPFQEGVFDGVVVRGAFFFLDERVLREIHRVLRAGGVGFVGGGFGALTPRNLIDGIAAESRRINARLGKRWMSRTDLEGIITRSRLGKFSQLIEDGGLWVILRK